MKRVFATGLLTLLVTPEIHAMEIYNNTDSALFYVGGIGPDCNRNDIHGKIVGQDHLDYSSASPVAIPVCMTVYNGTDATGPQLFQYANISDPRFCIISVFVDPKSKKIVAADNKRCAGS